MREGRPLWQCAIIALPISLLSMAVWSKFGPIPAAGVLVFVSLVVGFAAAALRS